MAFVNRKEELASLEEWWSRRGPGFAFIWGRRRMGKTALIRQFAGGKRAILHTGSRRPLADELAGLSWAAAGVVNSRDLKANHFHSWPDVFETLAQSSKAEPILLVLDEFPELAAVVPELPSLIRATWDNLPQASNLRLLLCGSAVRTMQAMREERAPLYGRAELSLLVHPFRPHEAAAMLPTLSAPDQALVWGIVGGVPLYLQWWDQNQDVAANLIRLAGSPGAPLLSEGQLVLATEGEAGDLSQQVLAAVARGKTRHNEIADAVRADPARTLERLVELRMIERVVPVTEDPRRTRRRIYRIADNFLAFWLGVLDRHRPEIELGLGRTNVRVILQELDDHMGPRWEEAFRVHLRRMAAEGRLDPEAVAVGPYWNSAANPVEIDAVVLAGRSRRPVLVGEAKWSRMVDASAQAAILRRKVLSLPGATPETRLAVCARESISGDEPVLRISAEDIFAP